jgi:ParB family transcriptional regulator, chromosome partitioning protein
MKSQHIEQIPIAKIRVLNPRDRNRKTFRGIVANMELVGLKKPITVFRRKLASDGTEYDLVCGQGRMEAVMALGGKTIPALITAAPLRERHLMSLVENIARKRPPLSDLMTEVRSLQERGYNNATIAEKLGVGKRYLDGIVRLLRCGEEELVSRVSAGTVPLHVAIKIATAPDGDIQKALSDAYASGELRGAKLIAVQRIITHRITKTSTGETTALRARPAIKDLARVYESYTEQQRALMQRAAKVHERLALLKAAFGRLLSDKLFVDELRSQKLEMIPEMLAERGI